MANSYLLVGGISENLPQEQIYNFMNNVISVYSPRIKWNIRMEFSFI